MNKALPWMLGAVLVLGAGAMAAITPTEDSLLEPFVVRGGADGATSSRALTASVTEAVFADRLEVPRADWSADGNWLLVTLEASAAQTEKDAVIGLATLTIDGRVFQASERPSSSLLQTRLHVGTAIEGTLAFELPAALRSGAAELQMTPRTSIPQLDDVVSIPLDLGRLDATPRFTLDAPAWAQ